MNIDNNTFQKQIRGVQRLKPTNKVSFPKRSRPNKKITRQHSELEFFDQEIYSNTNIDIPPVTSQQPIFFARAGLQKSTLRRLKRGQLLIREKLDLHGMNINQAQLEVKNFIMQNQLNNQKCILIIHGKGEYCKNNHPILKNMLNGLLRELPEVLAFCSALPKDGGTGTIYVLLKRI